MVVKRRAGTMDFKGDDCNLPLHEAHLEYTIPLHKVDIREQLKEYGKSLLWSNSSSGRKGKEDQLPTRSSNPQSASDDELPMRSTLIFTAKKRKSTFSFAVFFFCMIGAYLYSHARSALIASLTEVSDLVALSQRLDIQMKATEKDVHLLQRQLAALDVMGQRQDDMDTERRIREQASAFANAGNMEVFEEMNSIQEKLKMSSKKAAVLREQVREISRVDVIAKYGAGVHRVEMELAFPSTDNNNNHNQGPSILVIETAPLDLMPHSVHTFLEMVSYGLLDGCSFILNALHVLKAAPLPFDGSSASVKATEFTKHGLESVAFREYSEHYPHKKHTVGFAADGSPSFYINTEDNTEIHVGDPCFGRIVAGFDTLQRLENSPTRNGIWFERRIGIKRATILQ